MPASMSRRVFCKAAVGAAGAAGVVAASYGSASDEVDEINPHLLFVDLQQNYSQPEQAARAFVNAKSPFLMASYAVFFPELMRMHGSSVVPKLRAVTESVKRDNPHDHHRLEVMPAIAASHLLCTTMRDEKRELLCQEIADVLNHAKHRERLEMVTQNLVSACSPNVDSMRYFAANPSVVSGVQRVLRLAEEDEHYLAAGSISLEFLLNAELLLKSAGQKVESEMFSHAIDDSISSNATHFWHLRVLADAFRRSFRTVRPTSLDIPPQSSESLIGWKKLSSHCREYLQAIAAIRVRLLKQSYDVAVGRKNPTPAISVEQANRALGKSIAFFQDFDIHHLLAEEWPLNRAKRDDLLFKNFVEFDLARIVANPETYGYHDTEMYRSSVSEKALAMHVPFRQHDSYALTREAKGDTRFWSTVAVGALGAFGAVELLCKGTGAAVEWFEGRAKGQYGDERVAAVPANEAIEQLDNRLKGMDSRSYEGVEEMQEELGDIELPETD